MIDKEKLVDVFMHMGDHIRSLDEYGFCYDSTLAKAIEDVVAMLKQPEAVLDNQVSSSKWIPVSERLPDKDGEYLVRFADKGILNAEYESKFGSFGYWFSVMWDEDADWFSYVGVTHWMPLPEPPKGEE